MSDVIEPEVLNSRELVAAPDDTMQAFGGDPRGAIQRASTIATYLAEIIEKRDLSVAIKGQRHLKVEAWLTLGSLCGVMPRTEWTRREMNDGEIDFVARVEVVRLYNGMTIGGAEAGCSMGETLTRRDGSDFRRWEEEHAARSMAQTRATSKALAQCLRWIVVLAGYSGTPLEEMPANDSGRGGPPGQVTPVGSSLGGTEARPPRPVSARSAPAEKPLPVSLDGGWLDELVGFGKFKDRTWRQMSEGDFGGQRHSYCQWIVNTPSKYPGDDEKKRRAIEIIRSYEATTVAQNPAADAAPRSEGWMEEQPPVPQSEFE